MQSTLDNENEVIDPTQFYELNHQNKWVFNFHKVKDFIFEKHPVYRTDLGYVMYQDGVYKPVTKKDILHVIQKVITTEANSYRKNEIFSLIEGENEFIALADFNGRIRMVNLHNGLYNFTMNNFTKHNPFIFSTIQLPVKYDRDANCDKLIQVLKNVLDGDDLEFFFEWLAYCMASHVPPEKMLFLYGRGENGKSTLIDIMKAFLGKENISSVPLNMIANNRFASSQLYGKISNLNADISADVLRDTSTLKQLTGGNDMIMAEFKGQDPFTFINFAKLTFSCNELPVSVDKTHGFHRRILILPLKKVISGNQKIEKDKLLRIINDPKQLSGLLNIVIDKYKKLYDNGWKFTISDQMRAEMELYQYEHDKLQQFIDENIEVTGKEMDKIQGKDFCFAYARWCDGNRIKHIEQNKKIFQWLRDKNIPVEKKTGNKTYAVGVKFLPTSDYIPAGYLN